MAPKGIDPPEGVDIPEGYRLVKETRDQRLQLLITPSLQKRINEQVEAENAKKHEGEKTLSRNELIVSILEKYFYDLNNK